MQGIEDLTYEILTEEFTEYDLSFKIIVVGDSGVGKSCLTMKGTKNHYEESYSPTVGFEFFTFNIRINDKNIKLQIWDTAGQDRFRAITKNYYKGANGIILIYDVTNMQTYENVKNWISQIKEEASPNVIIYLVGNKIDVPDEQRLIKAEDGQKIADEFNLPFKEASAKDGTNVNEIFQELLEEIDEKYAKIEVPKGERKNQLFTGKKKKSWC